jgi:predicted O-methyltransferase YrrM
MVKWLIAWIMGGLLRAIDGGVGAHPRPEAPGSRDRPHTERGFAEVVHNRRLTARSAMPNRTLPLDDTLYQYVLDHSLREHPAQTALREATRSHAYAGMQISPEQGQFMALLIRLMGARRTIEIGVFTGYSALTVALALPEDGRLLGCDINDAYTRVGKPFWEQARVAHKIDLRLAPAVETLDACLAKGEAGQYDFAFIDADKTGYDAYYERCLRLLRSGGLIAIDNTLWNGQVARPSNDADTVALQALNVKLHRDERVDLALLPFSDGITLARKR